MRRSLLPFVATFILGGFCTYAALRYWSPAAPPPPPQMGPDAHSPRPHHPPVAPPALIVPDETNAAALKEANFTIKSLTAALTQIARERDEAVAKLRLIPTPEARAEGVQSLASADGTAVAVYDPKNRVLQFSPEDAILIPADGKVLLGRKAEIASDLKSTAGETVATLRFENETEEDVYLFWIDYEGRPVPYDRIAPGAFSERPTYMTHPWVVTDLNGNRIGDVKPELPTQTEVIPVTK